MKTAAARTVLRVHFGERRGTSPVQPRVGRVPRVARLLALAHKIDEKIRAGEFRDLADAAKHLGLTRARISQTTNLLLLAPEIQEAILSLSPVTHGRDTISERVLRPVVAEPDWQTQRKLWKEIAP